MTTLYEMPIAAEEDRDRVVRELRRKRAEERLAIFGALRKCALGIPDPGSICFYDSPIDKGRRDSRRARGRPRVGACRRD